MQKTPSGCKPVQRDTGYIQKPDTISLALHVYRNLPGVRTDNHTDTDTAATPHLHLNHPKAFFLFLLLQKATLK